MIRRRLELRPGLVRLVRRKLEPGLRGTERRLFDLKGLGPLIPVPASNTPVAATIRRADRMSPEERKERIAEMKRQTGWTLASTARDEIPRSGLGNTGRPGGTPTHRPRRRVPPARPRRPTRHGVASGAIEQVREGPARPRALHLRGGTPPGGRRDRGTADQSAATGTCVGHEDRHAGRRPWSSGCTSCH